MLSFYRDCVVEKLIKVPSKKKLIRVVSQYIVSLPEQFLFP